MRDGVPEKHVSTTSGWRPSASKICAPLYDWSVEMPILDMTLSNPLASALRYALRSSASSGASSSVLRSLRIRAATKPSALSLASASYATRGQTPSAPKPTASATSWTSFTSPASAKSAAFPRWPVFSRCWCTAPTARSVGTGRRSGPARTSDSTKIVAPGLPNPPWTAAAACSQIDASAASSATSDDDAFASSGGGKSAPCRGNVASTVAQDQPSRFPSSWSAASSSGVRTGCSTTRRAQFSAPASSKFDSGPTGQTNDMTSSSRIGSMGGFVTCAKSCLK
mmetsp:Transcript_25316/g.78974  ORF Transcript_25316/g.78974 Transcript_25316/m.78974 type:complete len:282 (+) Transcript_25316:743-1588(+)